MSQTHARTPRRQLLALLIYDLLTYDTRLFIAATRDNIAVAAAYALTTDTLHILPAYVHTVHT